MNRWAGLAITLMLGLGIAGVLFFNLETSGPLPNPRTPGVDTSEETSADAVDPQSLTGPSGTFREYPVGDPVERPDEHLEIGAVWFPAVAMEGMPHPGSDVIHLEADVKATALNPNGFARGQFVPYLKILYKIEPESGDSDHRRAFADGCPRWSALRGECRHAGRGQVPSDLHLRPSLRRRSRPPRRRRNGRGPLVEAVLGRVGLGL